MTVSDHFCHHVRELASLELDGELNELDRARLLAHVRACPSCRDFRRGVATTTRALRSAPLAQPDRHVVLPQRRHRVGLRAVQVSAVAATLLVVTGVGLFVPLHLHARTRPTAPTLVRLGPSSQPELSILRDVRLDQIKPRPVGLAGAIQ